MAGLPTKKIIDFIKFNALYIYISAGVVLKLKHEYDVSSKYKIVYSKNDYERKTHLQDIRDYIDNQSKN